jgi:hypothetical protein
MSSFSWTWLRQTTRRAQEQPSVGSLKWRTVRVDGFDSPGEPGLYFGSSGSTLLSKFKGGNGSPRTVFRHSFVTKTYICDHLTKTLGTVAPATAGTTTTRRATLPNRRTDPPHRSIAPFCHTHLGVPHMYKKR